MKQADQDKVTKVLAALIKKTPKGQVIGWAGIMEAVKAEVVVKNWLYVRALLGAFMKTGAIKRTADLKVEDYVVL